MAGQRGAPRSPAPRHPTAPRCAARLLSSSDSSPARPRRASHPASGGSRGTGDSVANWSQVGETRPTAVVHHALDQEIAEADPRKPALAVADRIENRGVGLRGVEQRRLPIEQASARCPPAPSPAPPRRRSAARPACGDGRRRSSGGRSRAGSSGRASRGFRAPPRSRPAFPADAAGLFQSIRAQLQEADVEPARQQPPQVALQRREHRDRPQRCAAGRRAGRPGIFTPSGMVLNWVSRRSRGGSSARRNCALAAARAGRVGGRLHTSPRRRRRRRGRSRSRRVRAGSRRGRPRRGAGRPAASLAARLRALTSPPRPARQARIWPAMLSSSSWATPRAISRQTPR